AQFNRGEQLFEAGQAAEAAQVFQAILQQLGDTPTDKRAVTLGLLGRCFLVGGRPDLAAQSAREALTVLGNLEQSDGVKRSRGMRLTDLADALAEQGRFAEARQAYQDGLKVAEELTDLRQRGVVLGQLGTLAIREGKLTEASDRYHASLALFQQLREPASEAVVRHQLGVVFQEARQWGEAERHYRESARIKEENGIISGPNGAATTWNQLANVALLAGNPDAAEMWYRKAIQGFRSSDPFSPAGGEGRDEGARFGGRITLSLALSNLANLLRTQPGRLAEARRLAEEALAISKTLDPGAASIWKTYDILADIAEQEAQAAPDDRRKAELQAQAREHRRLAREAKRNFAGTRHELLRHAPVILAACMAAQDPEQRPVLGEVLRRYADASWKEMVAAIHRIVAGERDEESLQEGQFGDGPLILDAILAGLRDPQTLADLLPSEPSKAE
ncbi:MAG: tetratricopeptide repeat protein, partial [Verrucomicrobiales bacterium]|nr:tetratricopeptide repeat protein [Verrucomicrobiales bacterium]